MEKPRTDAEDSKRTGLRLGLGIAALVVVGLIAWATLGGDDDSTDDAGEAAIVSVDSLREAGARQDTPIYWAGEQAGTELELSLPNASHAYVRYLTGGAKAGDSRPDFLTVGTYASPNPVAELKGLGNEPGGVLRRAPGGATVYFSRSQPESVYLAYPGVKAQIEVYDPNFKRALQLVNSGQIVAAG